MALSLLIPLSMFLSPGGQTSPPDAPFPPAQPELICRGYEDSGNITEDQPAWPCHLVNLFVTGKNPHSPGRSIQQHVDWVSDPNHSYVNDGRGGLAVWAHPSRNDADAILALRGLTGVEISCHGDAVYHEPLWDRLLTGCHDAGRAYLWGFPSDDTHSKQADKIGLSFLAARLGTFTESELKRALAAGAFYVTTGPLIEDIQVRGGTITLSLPAEGEVRWLRSGQFGFGDPAVVGSQAGENHCLKRDLAVRRSSYTLNDADGTADLKSGRFVRAIVLAGPGKAAQTMPFKIVGAVALENPYPPAGAWYRGQTHNHCDATGRRLTPAIDYHRAYREKGLNWEFATDYGYWLTPFQRHPDVLATIDAVHPDRGANGEPTRITLFGRLFPPETQVLIAGRPATDIKWLFENRIEAIVPGDLPVGPHDVTVIAGRFKDTLAGGFTVQADNADNAGWTRWAGHDSGLPADRSFCVAMDKDGAVWAGTQYGAARFDGARWIPVTRENNAFIGEAILSIAADRAGNTWFGSFRGLARRSADGQWQVYRTEQGLPSREVNRCFVDSRDRLWISYNGRTSKISRFDGRQWQHFDPPNGDGRMSLSIAQDPAGRILVSSRNKGVAVLDGEKWTTWTSADTGLPGDYVYRIVRAADGGMLFALTPLDLASPGGVAVLSDGKWTRHSVGAEGRKASRVWDVLQDRQGNLWCATSVGLSRRTPDGKWATYTTANSGLAFDYVLGLCQHGDGSIWCATARGVCRFLPKK